MVRRRRQKISLQLDPRSNQARRRIGMVTRSCARSGRTRVHALTEMLASSFTMHAKEIDDNIETLQNSEIAFQI